jgi:mannose-1-phosphate guanylyltransferase
MRALLLAAGLGTRLRPLTDTVPKCMVDIDGRPLLDHWIRLLGDAGVTDILVNLHHLPAPVEQYLAGIRRPGVRIETVHEERLLMTGGTVLKNRGFFRGEPAMVIHADNLSLFDVKGFMRRFETRARHIDITMMTFRTDAPHTCGIVEVDDEGTVVAFHEKVACPPGDLANGAVYIFAPAAIDFMDGLKKETIDLSTEVLPHFLGRINTFRNDMYHRDIGTIDSLRAARVEYPLARRAAHRAGLLGYGEAGPASERLARE